ncbi:MAG: hypothetical protein AB9866_16675 [Syntrophobacteraceae bacterium]
MNSNAGDGIIKASGKVESNEIEGKPASGEILVSFRGDDNLLTIKGSVKVSKGLFNFNGNGSEIVIDEDVVFNGIVTISSGCKIYVGKGTRMNHVCRFSMLEPSSITIGKDCLFSNVFFRTSDGHVIYDVSSGERINPPADIVVGDHVWLSEDVKIYKGCRIENWAIIGGGSIVTGHIPAESICAGIPARVVRTGVRWGRNLQGK